MRIKILFFILLSGLILPSKSQVQESRQIKLSKKADKFLPKDDPQARIKFEVERLKNPASGIIPRNIRNKELEFTQQNQLSVARIETSNSIVVDWSRRGPYNVGGRTRALAIDVTNENILLAGGVSGGVWRSTDQGANWVKTTGSDELQSVTAIAQDPRVGFTNIWYYTTGEISGNSAGGFDAPYRGDGVYKSIDGGLTWSGLESTLSGTPEVFDSNFDYCHEVVVSPIDGSVIVANYGGIYVSEDQGLTWPKFLVNDFTFWTDVVVSSQGIIYAWFGPDGIFKSEDNGENWINLTPQNFPVIPDNRRGELALSPSNENILYVLAMVGSHATSHTLWRFDESTDVWSDRTSGLPNFISNTTFEGTGVFDSQGGYDLLIKVHPQDENFVIIGGTNLFASSDGFSSSGTLTQPPYKTTTLKWIGGYSSANDSYGLYPFQHPDQHALVFFPSNPDRVLSGNDGGVQITENIKQDHLGSGDVSWTPLNNGYFTSQAYAISIGPGDRVLAGFQDNGTWSTTSDNPNATWLDVFGGDGAYSDISNDGRSRYVSSQNGFIYQFNYTDAADNTLDGFTEFTPDFDVYGYESGLFITPFYLDPVDNEVFYLGGRENLFVNTNANNGSSTTFWKEILLTGSTDPISEIGVTHDNIVYAGNMVGQVFRIENPKSATPAVTDITSTEFQGGYVSGIAVNPYNPDEILLSFSNYGIKSVFHSLTGGDTWMDVSGNLEQVADGSGNGPSVRTVSILGNGNQYFVGTSTGLYATELLNGGSTTWTKQSAGIMGNVVVEHLVSNHENGKIYAGTHGNGIYCAQFGVSGDAQNDLALIEITSPVSGQLGDEAVTIEIGNFGALEQSDFEVSYSVNGTPQSTEVVTQSYASGDILEYTFLQTFDFSAAGTYEIMASVNLTSDEAPGNNTLTKSIFNINKISTYPYVESFEISEAEWVGDLGWELGVPNGTTINAASDGVNAWVTNLNGDYANNGQAILLSPVFDFSTIQNPVTSFDIQYEIEEGWDGAVLAYRTNLDVENYTTITTANGIQNWYNMNVEVTGSEAWTGSSGGYANAQANLDFLNNEPIVQFAFILYSDETIVDEGLSIDNFKIEGSNQNPSDIQLSNQSIQENSPVSSLIGVLSTTDDDSDIHTYSLVDGTGGEDNASFVITGNELFSSLIFNHEAQSSYDIRIQSENDIASTFAKAFTISIQNVNDAPTDIFLSNDLINEDEPTGSIVGMFTTLDEDANDSFTYALVAGVNDDDNSSFQVDNDLLKTAEVFDFSVKQVYHIRVQSTDLDGISFDRDFEITILEANENDAPTNLLLSNTSIEHLQSSGTLVGELTATDPNDDVLSFNFDTGEGDEDNGNFTIQDHELLTDFEADYFAKSEYSVRIAASDGELSQSSIFLISVEEPLLLGNLSHSDHQIFPNPVGHHLSVKITDDYRGTLYVSIFNTKGKNLMQFEFNKATDLFKKSLDLSALRPGFYLIQFDFDDDQVVGTLIKQ